MPRSRKLAILATFVVIAAVGAGAAWQMSGRLPDPAAADREGLMRWMVTRDLAIEPEPVRQALIDRLESELRVGIDLEQVDAQTDEQQSRQFQKNIDLLLQNWFEREAKRHVAYPKAQRADALNRRIDDVLDWQNVRDLRKQYRNGAGGGEFELIKACQQRTNDWIEQAEPQQAAQMKKFFAAVVQSLVRRSLEVEVPVANDH